jgi:hypothetical protein
MQQMFVQVISQSLLHRSENNADATILRGSLMGVK